MVDCTLALGLSKALYRPVSDVQGGVVVGIVAMAATQAVETGAVTIAFVHVAAPVAPLARVRGIDHHDLDAFGGGAL